MNVDEMLTGVRDAMQARMVFSEPVERDGMTVIPAANVRGGGGGGGDNANNGGGGFGLVARPAGAYVMHNGAVDWQPAVDVNRIVLGSQIVAVIALLVLRTWLKSRGRAPDSARAAWREAALRSGRLKWLRGTDSNRRPSGYEPDELPLLHPAMERAS